MSESSLLADVVVVVVTAGTVLAGGAVFAGHRWILGGYAREADVDERFVSRVGGALLVGIGVSTAGLWMAVRARLLGPDRLFAVTFLGVGLLLFGFGAMVRRGHTWLLSNYDPHAVDDEERVARLAGGGLAALGAVTLALGVATGTGLVAPTDLRLWTVWSVLVVVLSLWVAGVASGA